MIPADPGKVTQNARTAIRRVAAAPIAGPELQEIGHLLLAREREDGGWTLMPHGFPISTTCAGGGADAHGAPSGLGRPPGWPSSISQPPACTEMAGRGRHARTRGSAPREFSMSGKLCGIRLDPAWGKSAAQLAEHEVREESGHHVKCSKNPRLRPYLTGRARRR
jgi:hypothetical protein